MKESLPPPALLQYSAFGGSGSPHSSKGTSRRTDAPGNRHETGSLSAKALLKKTHGTVEPSDGGIWTGRARTGLGQRRGLDREVRYGWPQQNRVRREGLLSTQPPIGCCCGLFVTDINLFLATSEAMTVHFVAGRLTAKSKASIPTSSGVQEAKLLGKLIDEALMRLIGPRRANPRKQ